LYIANFFHNPPTFMDPGTPGAVFRYDGTSASLFAVGGNPANFFDVAFPSLAAVPETNTVVIGIMICSLLLLHFERRRRARTRR
ncbi:MAG TPA: hypothetical protein VJ719_09705, partial [Chthoniobacterales bacterium]|nr:hypothetical protein [Chthoniobacterales bacterium]